MCAINMNIIITLAVHKGPHTRGNLLLATFVVTLMLPEIVLFLATCCLVASIKLPCVNEGLKCCKHTLCMHNKKIVATPFLRNIFNPAPLYKILDEGLLSLPFLYYTTTSLISAPFE